MDGVDTQPATVVDAGAADGYDVAFGDFADPRIWEPVMLHDRLISVVTAPSFEVSRDLAPAAQQRFPGLTRIAVVPNEA